MAVDANLGWLGPDKYVAVVPQIFNLYGDPQERYDLFMNNFTERTWLGPVMGDQLTAVMKTYAAYPPRKLQSDGYDGPIKISTYEKVMDLKKELQNYKIDINPGQ